MCPFDIFFLSIAPIMDVEVNVFSVEGCSALVLKCKSPAVSDFRFSNTPSLPNNGQMS